MTPEEDSPPSNSLDPEKARSLVTDATPPSDVRAGGGESRVNKSFFNYLASSFLTVFMMVVGFVSTPLLLKWLGTERFGAMRAMNGWLSYLVLLELGLSGVLATRFVKALGQGRSQDVVAVAEQGMLNARRTAFWMIVVGVILGAACTWLVPVSPELRGELRASVFISLTCAALFPFIIFRSLVEADQRGYLVVWLIGLQSGLLTGFSLLFAWLGWGMPGQAAATVIALMPMPFTLAIYCWRRYRTTISALWRAKDDPEIRTDFRRIGFAAFVIGLCERVGVLTDEVVIARMLNPVSVSPFVVTQRLPSLMQGQLTAISGSTWAGMSQLHVSGRREIFVERILELSKLVMFLGTCAAVPVAIFNQSFVSLWVGSGLYAGDLLTCISLINAVMLSLIIGWVWVLAFTGHMHELLPVQIVATTVNILVSTLGTYALMRFDARLAMVGPPAGTLAGILLIQIWWIPILLRRHFGVPLRRLLKALAAPLLPAIPLALAGHYFTNHRAGQLGWGELIVQLAMLGFANLALGWFLVLSRTERHTWADRLKNLLGSRISRITRR